MGVDESGRESGGRQGVLCERGALWRGALLRAQRALIGDICTVLKPRDFRVPEIDLQPRRMRLSGPSAFLVQEFMHNVSLTGGESSAKMFGRQGEGFGAFEQEGFEGAVFVVLMEGAGGGGVRAVSFPAFGRPMFGGTAAAAAKVPFDDLGDADQPADPILIRVRFRRRDGSLNLFSRRSRGREGMQT